MKTDIFVPDALLGAEALPAAPRREEEEGTWHRQNAKNYELLS